MKKIILGIWMICMAACLPVQTVRAQNSEIGACVGTTFYLGELNPSKLFAQPGLAAGLVYRYNLSPRWALKADFLFGKVSASDATTNGGYERNLSFYSPITEFSAVAELNFLKLYNTVGQNHFAPYIFAGFTVFSFNPMAQYTNGTVYELQSLGTEGQGLEDMPKKYSLTSVAIPFGIGLRVNIGKYVCLGAEWGFRYTFTDYLDDVGGRYYDNDLLREQRGDIIANMADRTPELIDPVTGNALPLHKAGEQRGNSTTHDIYSFAGATVTVKFGNADRTCDLKKPHKRKKY